MRTPKEYTDNLKKRTITEDMLNACLFSTNKRAKNWRDKKREYKGYRFDKYGNYERAEAEEQKMYSKKEILFSIVSPDCIHREPARYERIRVYDYQSNFKNKLVEHILKNNIIWANSYLDRESWCEVFFFDYEDHSKPIYRYYLFYNFGTHSYHTPIEAKDVKSFRLPIVAINTLDTHGNEIADLLSVQFVDKVIELICSGNFQYIPDKWQKPAYSPSLLDETNLTPEISSAADYAEIAAVWRSWGDYLNPYTAILEKLSNNEAVYVLSDQEKSECKKSQKRNIRKKLDKLAKNISRNKKHVGIVKLNMSPKHVSAFRFRPNEMQIQAMIEYCKEHGYTAENCYAAAIPLDDKYQEAMRDISFAKTYNDYAAENIKNWAVEVLEEDNYKPLKAFVGEYIILPEDKRNKKSELPKKAKKK